MWVLIMTIYLTGSYSSGLSVTTVDGFTSEEKCINVGEKQKQALIEKLNIRSQERYTFICVKKGN